MKFGPVRLLAGAPNGIKLVSPIVSGLPSPRPVGPVPGSDSRMPSNRTPEIVMVFRFPNGHCGIGHGDVYQGEQARELNGAQSSLVSNLHRDLIVEPRRCAQAWRAIIGPENADKCLFFRALRPRGATQVFHFVVRGSVSRACHVGRRRRAELTRRADHKRNALAPVRTQARAGSSLLDPAASARVDRSENNRRQRVGSGICEPSLRRIARMAVAVRCPKSIPFALCCALWTAAKSSAR